MYSPFSSATGWEGIAVSLFFRTEGDIGQNSPTVQIEANMAQDRLRANREIGRRGWRSLAVGYLLTDSGKRGILQLIPD